MTLILNHNNLIGYFEETCTSTFVNILQLLQLIIEHFHSLVRNHFNIQSRNLQIK